MTGARSRRFPPSGPGVLLLAVAIATLLLAPLAFLLTRALWVRWTAILILAWWLPGALLVAHSRLRNLDLPAAAVLAFGLGFCWMILIALVLSWLPGAIGLWPLVAAYEVGALLLLLALIWHRPVGLQPARPATWARFAVLLLLAVLLRLPGIGYHEFHVDEVNVLRPAADAIQGNDAALAGHYKVPGEIAVSLVFYRALGTANETTARLPFGLLSVGSVLAVAILGRRLFSPMAGFWAGLLFACNGFALGLSRIAQYQAAVLLLSALAVLAGWEFARRGEGRWLVLSATFSAFGLIMHYEFGLLAPALLVLAWAGWRRAPDKRRVGLILLLVGLAGAVLLAGVYVPFLLNPEFASTQHYLGVRLGGLGALNLAFFVEMGTFYNSSYFFFGLILLMLAGLGVGWRTARHQTLLLVLWFLPFFILYIFIMQFPGTHFYLLMESWSLLAALPLAALAQSQRLRPALRWAGLAFVVAWLLVSAGYLYLAFFRQSPEYVINYDQERVPFYWAPYGENIPAKPRFGFPLREGWKALGTLAEWGCLGNSYASNDRSRHLPGWYLEPLARYPFDAQPDYIYVARHVHELHPRFGDSVLEGYQRVGEVRVREEPRIEIWARQPLPVPYVTYHIEDFAIFDRVVPPLAAWPDPPVRVRDENLGGTMVLESAGLADTSVGVGDLLHLLLVWRPLQSLTGDYKLFVHLADEGGQPVAQWDSYPCSNTGRTSQWTAGEAVTDHVLLRIPDGTPPGEYSLLVGLYDAATGDRLGDRAIQVAAMTIR
jgi:hypothetical protein